MPNYQKCEYRPLATQRITNWIANSKCCHFDAWLYLSDKQYLLFVVRLALGGRKGMTKDIKVFGLVGRDYDDFVELEGISLRNAREIKTNSSFLTDKMRAAIEVAHWKHIQPMSRGDWRRQYKRHSVMLHYVPIYTGDPTDGTVNYHGRDMDSEHNRAVAELARLLR